MRARVDGDAVHAGGVRNIADQRIVVGVHHLHMRTARDVEPMRAGIDREVVPASISAKSHAMRDRVRGGKRGGGRSESDRHGEQEAHVRAELRLR